MNLIGKYSLNKFINIKL